jgi:aminoglycoside phosphotransferase family enzyme
VGDRAYKLKKPVVLPFLDYGTPERRHTMCNEEVRLNRRLASGLYLGVRYVAAAAEGMRLAPQDDPRALDYLVEMGRYDERSTSPRGSTVLRSGSSDARSNRTAARGPARRSAGRARPKARL